jgi:hypothetical protein
MAKKVTVLRLDEEDDTLLTQTLDQLRTLRSLGIRFETLANDDDGLTVFAWIEDKEPKIKKERTALGEGITGRSSEIPT